MVNHNEPLSMPDYLRRTNQQSQLKNPNEKSLLTELYRDVNTSRLAIARVRNRTKITRDFYLKVSMPAVVDVAEMIDDRRNNSAHSC